MKISICIPNYNNGNYLEECIESVLVQNYDNYEIVISENNSLDNSIEVLKKYENHEKIKIFYRNETLPMTVHWNTFRDKIDGDIFYLLCSDDKFNDKYALYNVFRAFTEQNVCAVFFDSNSIVNGVVMNKVDYYENSAIIPCKQQYDIFLRGNGFSISCGMIRREIMDEIDWFDIEYKYCSDWDLWLNILGKRIDSNIIYIKKKLISYRIHESNETQKCIMDKSALKEIEKLKRKHISKNISQTSRDLLENYAQRHNSKVALNYAKICKKNNYFELKDYYINEAKKYYPNVIKDKMYLEILGIEYDSESNMKFVKPYPLPIGSKTLKGGWII